MNIQNAQPLHTERFGGKVALVTGGGHGIGRQIALDFAREGARVAVLDVDKGRAEAVAAEANTIGPAGAGFQADVRDSAQVRAAVQGVFTRLGRVDVLVNNAGIYPNSPVLTMTEEEWDRVWDINVKGMFLVTQAVASAMIAVRPGGRIINMSSGAADRARVGASHYCSSKAAISMFTKVLALEMAEHHINVNAVAPGLIEVPDWGLTQQYIDALVSMTPRGRIGTPQDISNAVRFLASDEADFMTGSVMVVDGGAGAGQNLPPSS
jgi:NAD(P)-dependent dehydrogenase (short-subunit alcohol dehydrogenase family)